MSAWPFPTYSQEELQKIMEGREFNDNPEQLFRDTVNSLPDPKGKWQMLFINIFFALYHSGAK